MRSENSRIPTRASINTWLQKLLDHAASTRSSGPAPELAMKSLQHGDAGHSSFVPILQVGLKAITFILRCMLAEWKAEVLRQASVMSLRLYQ